MNDRRHVSFGVAERLKDAPHAIERKVDQLGVETKQPCNDGIDGIHARDQARAGTGRWSAGDWSTGAGGCSITRLTGALLRRRQRLASVARNWCRCTTM